MPAGLPTHATVDYEKLISTKSAVLQDFRVILKRALPNYWKNLEESIFSRSNLLNTQWSVNISEMVNRMFHSQNE